jgi:hypothetical protein
MIHCRSSGLPGVRQYGGGHHVFTLYDTPGRYFLDEIGNYFPWTIRKAGLERRAAARHTPPSRAASNNQPACEGHFSMRLTAGKPMRADAGNGSFRRGGRGLLVRCAANAGSPLRCRSGTLASAAIISLLPLQLPATRWAADDQREWTKPSTTQSVVHFACGDAPRCRQVMAQPPGKNFAGAPD